MPESISCHVTTLGHLLNTEDTFIIPPFQRNYAWNEEQFTDFWNDISKTLENETPEYLLGSIVVNRAGTSDLLVIDGQQRLTTSSVLISALRNRLKVMDHTALAEQIENRYLARSQTQSQLFLPSLVLNGQDRLFYHDYIFNTRPTDEIERLSRDDSLPSSNKRLAECYLFMSEKIRGKSDDPAKISQFAENLIEAFRNRLVVIRIDVQDDQNGYLLFESLNERGRDLSKFDLLKNYLFSVSGPKLRSIQSNWEVMSQNLDDRKSVPFIRHHWMSTVEAISEKELFSRIKVSITSPEQANQYAFNLCAASEYYAALSESRHRIWTEFPTQTRKKIQELLEQIELLKAEQLFVVLLAILERDKSQFLHLLELLTLFTFRYTTICSFSSANLLTAFVKMALHIRNSASCSVVAAYTKFLAPLAPDDRQFHSSFARKSIRVNNLARYILVKINDSLMANPSLQTQTDPLKTDLEHILPKKFEERWILTGRAFPGGPEKYIYRLGNMTLISQKINQEVGNGNFSDKLHAYAQDTLAISQSILGENRWTADEINRRQNWMASQATKIWNIEQLLADSQ